MTNPRPTPPARIRVPDLRGLIAARGPLIASVVLAVAVAAQIGVAAAHWWRATRSPARAAAVAAGAPAIAGAGPIATARLFGSDSAPEPAAAASAGAWVLTGTLATADPGAGLAIVGASADRTRAVAAGAEIVAGLRLLEVYVDHVVVLRGDARETLALPRALLAGLGAREGAKGKGEALTAAVHPEAAPPLAAPHPPPLPDGTTALAALNLHAVRRDGRASGLRVLGASTAALATLGLQRDDVIVAWNGVRVGSADAAEHRSVRESLDQGESVSVTIERDGVELTRSITPDLAAAAARNYRAAVPR
jgi:type II secretory pathway component PulC